MVSRKLWAIVFAVPVAVACGASAGEDGFGVTNIHITCDRWPDHSSLKNFYTDICEIDDAQTDQEKTVTLLRWLRRTIKPGRRPDLDVYELDRTLAVLNMFGITDTDEMCEIATQIWRVAEGKPAYKIYLPKYDYTTAHLWYMDGKEERWHWFDYTNGTYLYARPPRRIAGANDLITDPSLYLVPSKGPVPASDRQDTRGWARRDGRDVGSLYNARAPGISIGPGQILNRWWVTPKREFNPGQILNYGDWLASNKLGDNDSDLGKALKQGNDSSERTESTPPNGILESHGELDFDGHGVIYEGLLSTKIVSQGPNGGTVTLFLTVDDGDKQELEKVDFKGASTKRVNILLGGKAKDNDVAAAVFGHRKFSLSYETTPLTPEDSFVIDPARVRVIIRQNQVALPALRAGKNRIAVRGCMPSGFEFRITYVWDDEDGMRRKHIAAIRSLPCEYTILTSASNDRNVICRNFICELVTAATPPSLTWNRVVSAPLAREKKLKYDGLQGNEAVDTGPEMKTQEQYVEDLESDDMWVKLNAARILAGIADENAFDALVPYSKDGTIPFKEKDQKYGTVRSWIAAAIAHTKHEDAADVLLQMLERNPGFGSDIASPDSWDLWAAIIALGKLGDEKAVEPLIDRYTFSQGPTKWIILQALTMLRDKRALELMRKEVLDSDIDVANAAAVGLLAMPDKESLGPLFGAGKNREGQALRICAARLAGRFKAKKYQSQLRKYLELDPLEEVRCWSVWALGEMDQDYDSNLSALEASMANEMSPWVLKKVETALKKIKKKCYLIR